MSFNNGVCMKRILLIGLVLLSFASSKAQFDLSLTAFGNAFLQGLAAGEQKQLDALWVSEQDVLPTMQAAGATKEQQDREIAIFRSQRRRMEALYASSYKKLMEDFKGKDLSKATLVEVRRTKELVEPLEPGTVDKTDLLLIFNVMDEQYVLKLDGALKCVSGWRFIAKFYLDSLDH